MTAKVDMLEHLAFLEALQFVEDGNQSAFAKLCGCTPGNIWQLVQNKSRLPGQYVLRIAAATGVPPWRLRPDLYPLDPSSTFNTAPETIPSSAKIGDFGGAAVPA